MQTPLLILTCTGLAASIAALAVTRARLARARNDHTRATATADDQGRHITTATRRLAELEATLRSMTEGVVVVDPKGLIRELNPAALQVLSLDPATSLQVPFPQAVRNAALQRLIDTALGRLPAPPDTTALQAEVTLRAHPGGSDHDRQLRAEAAPVLDDAGQRRGAVLVLHDLTRLRQLESVRQDFVANVSHELRTPVSAIKAAAEALLSEPPPDPDQRSRFTGIVVRQADRLDAIINDLLSLTQLDAAAAPATLSASRVAPVVAAAVEACGAHARDKRIVLQVDVPADLHARFVPVRLEQATVNLIDNAVKYSPPDTRVDIVARRECAPTEAGRPDPPRDEIVLAITDRGRGIEAHHLPRLFERFYRTDRARSRQLGGTGLGLSIVKHVVEQAGGHVSVESTPGVGSTFRLHLQAADPSDVADPDVS